MTLQLISGLQELSGRYDAAILDSWGVLHNGVEPYPGVLDCLARAREAGWRTVVLSNAPRSGVAGAAQVATFGVPADSYDEIITSGDLIRVALSVQAGSLRPALGSRFFHLGPERDYGILDGLEYEKVQELAECDFLLNTGLYDDETETEEDYAEFLAEANARKLPMLCANPDTEVNRGGKRIPCAGAVAKAYERIGGAVADHGKPARAAFNACIAKLPGVVPRRILVVGDSLATDIAGASRAGIDALFVVGGLHAEDFGYVPGVDLNAVALEAALVARGAVVTAAIPSLVW